jgi:hypothetical protein
MNEPKKKQTHRPMIVRTELHNSIEMIRRECEFRTYQQVLSFLIDMYNELGKKNN